MKAVLLYEFGGVDKLRYSDFSKPPIKPDSILIKIKAVALNHLDLFVRQGIPGLKLEMPHILGSDISGVVEEIGSDIESSDFFEGQKVVLDPSLSCGVCDFCIRAENSLCNDYGIIGEHVRGGYAEYISVKAENVIPIPEISNLDFITAAAAPLTFLTAYRMIVTRARVREGETVLITGIGGGVAIAAFQIAKLKGAKVIVTSSSNIKLQKALDLGADYGINYLNEPDFHKEAFNLTNRRGVDVVIDSAGQATWEKNMRALRKGGRLVTCGATTGPIVSTNINLLFWKQLELLGSTMGSRNELREVLKYVWEGKLTPIVDSTYTLERVKEAHKKLEDGKQFGKIVLCP